MDAGRECVVLFSGVAPDKTHVLVIAPPMMLIPTTVVALSGSPTPPHTHTQRHESGNCLEDPFQESERRRKAKGRLGTTKTHYVHV